MDLPKDVTLLAGIFTLAPASRRAAGLASVAVLAGVFPGNLKMAVDASRSRNTRFKAVAYGRLPLQLPMIRIAWRAGT